MKPPVHVTVQMATVGIPVKVSGPHGGAANCAQVMLRICFMSAYVITCSYKCILLFTCNCSLCLCSQDCVIHQCIMYKESITCKLCSLQLTIGPQFIFSQCNTMPQLTVHAPLVFCQAQCQKVEVPLKTVQLLEWELSLVSFIPVRTTLTPTIVIQYILLVL